MTWLTDIFPVYEPRHLQAARRAVETRLGPLVQRDPPLEGPAGELDLVTRLRRCPEDELGRFARSLRAGERRTLCFLVPGLDPGLRRKALRVLARIPPALTVQPLVAAVEAYPACGELVEALSVCARRGRRRPAPPDPIWELVDLLLDGEHPVASLVDRLDHRRASFLDAYEALHPLLTLGAPLCLEVRRRAFFGARARHYDLEAADELIAWFDVEGSDDRARLFQRFLNVSPRALDLDDPLTWACLERYGRPDEGDAGFWAGVREEVRDRLRLLLRLAGFLDNERFRFWKAYAHRARSVRLNQRRDALWIDFGRFFVIEFADVGNAAYVYDGGLRGFFEGRFDRVMPPALKDMNFAIHRVIHRAGWEAKTARVVDELLGASDRPTQSRGG